MCAMQLGDRYSDDTAQSLGVIEAFRCEDSMFLVPGKFEWSRIPSMAQSLAQSEEMKSSQVACSAMSTL